jgi:hypothetical protein
METRTISEELKKRVLERDDYTCRYCGKRSHSLHVDHVYPYSKGGETTINNLVTACSRCNLEKHNKVGIFPKPLGYFEPRTPSTISFVFSFAFSFACVVQLILGSLIYIYSPEFGFWMIAIGVLSGFISVCIRAYD